MTLPSPTTLHYQTTVHFSATFISTLTKIFSQSDYHHVSRFIHRFKQGRHRNTRLLSAPMATKLS
ncbi:hypothetical protein JHK86_043216 [Glycine max]|nr:hypothetical protein JHK86_043216 [Glycine max]